MNLKHLIVDLQSLGVSVPETGAGRRGGAGPAEGQAIIIGGRCCNVPTHSWYVAESPYRISPDGAALTLYRHDEPVCRVTFPERPRYYDLKTPDGVSLEKTALTHGRDCLASTVYQDCAYRNTGQECRFCGISLSLHSGATVRVKTPENLAFAAARAKELDSVRHVTLTTGAWPDERAGAEHLAQCVQAIKQAAGLPVHVQICPPDRIDVIDRLRQAGADTIGIHIEAAGAGVLEQIAPAKAAIGLAAYIRCWEYAVSVFGRNQVSSFLIAGLGELQEKIISAANLLCSLGVFPYLLPLRPIPGTPLAAARPPAAGVMLHLYAEVAGILKKYGMASAASKAGCVRCGACSALALFEE
jgi:radical SAM protein (TIGR04043 family)